MKKIALSIADLHINFIIKSKDNNFSKNIFSRYRNFVLDNQRFSNSIDVYFIDDLPSFKNITISENLIVGDGFIFEKNNLYVRKNLYSFENFLRVFYSYELIFNNGFLIHCAGVSLGKKGYIFVGKSGSGKTTISQMLKKDFYIISDELCAIRILNGKFLIYSTPFWGSFKKPWSYNVSFELNSIFFLVKSKKVFLRETNRKIAAKKLFKCIVNFSSGCDVNIKLVDMVLELLEKVEFKNLYFNKNKNEVINFLKSTFNK